MVLARAVDLKDVVMGHEEIRVAGGAGEFSELLFGADVNWTCGLDFTQMRQLPAAFFRFPGPMSRASKRFKWLVELNFIRVRLVPGGLAGGQSLQVVRR